MTQRVLLKAKLETEDAAERILEVINNAKQTLDHFYRAAQVELQSAYLQGWKDRDRLETEDEH